MDERRRKAWAALGIGPAWLLRDPARIDGAVHTDGGGDRMSVGDAAPLPAPGAQAPPTSEARPAERRIEPPAVEQTFEPASAAPSEPAPNSMSGTGTELHEMPGTEPETEPETEQTPEQAVALARSRAPSADRDPVIARLPWAALSEAVADCRACGLCEGRRNTVFGSGPQSASWLLVGEAPGQQEDLSGEPFVGDAGRLLDQMLRAIGVDRPSEAFIANVIKCRPPGNRDPKPEEVARCEPYLLRQVELLRPRMIVVLGRFAAQSLLRTDAKVASLRGRVHALRVGDREVPTVVTYHPAYLLRTLPDKAKAWADLRLARRTFDAQG